MSHETKPEDELAAREMPDRIWIDCFPINGIPVYHAYATKDECHGHGEYVHVHKEKQFEKKLKEAVDLTWEHAETITSQRNRIQRLEKLLDCAVEALDRADYELEVISCATIINIDDRKLIQWENSYHAKKAHIKSKEELAKIREKRGK